MCFNKLGFKPKAICSPAKCGAFLYHGFHGLIKRLHQKKETNFFKAVYANKITIASNIKNQQMRKQQNIFIHQRCGLGCRHSLPQATALKPIGNDWSSGRMENVYPDQRPGCVPT